MRENRELIAGSPRQRAALKPLGLTITPSLLARADQVIE
jgi:hypothetical protein